MIVAMDRRDQAPGQPVDVDPRALLEIADQLPSHGKAVLDLAPGPVWLV